MAGARQRCIPAAAQLAVEQTAARVRSLAAAHCERSPDNGPLQG
jgi:hypothetical protein